MLIMKKQILIESGSAFCIERFCLHQFSVIVYLHQSAVACLCQDCARYYRISIKLRQC
ncbi:hypothetical protein SeV_B1957 [Salmonella enterica subsp. enterica serovar Virchow str. SL491]|uniref:Uncharacterized protein n=1 Tax=Salmonella virchow (strain SL491) TaxID=465517 RepID=A0A6C8F3L1_SALV4|nr:hypothetical protein SeV_B1957 [Salmonella enterica subsp. enterica serovar Virchow str. SL491]